jgi:nitronate monooxygenase
LAPLHAPLVLAPMAGSVCTPELVAAVANAGGLGMLAAGYLGVETLAERIAATRELTDRAFGVNLFVPGSDTGAPEGAVSEYAARVAVDAVEYGVEIGEPRFDDDDYPAKLELVLAERASTVSFTFGLPAAGDVDRLHAAGAAAIATVTTPREARAAERLGVDALCCQGLEAGGHRGCFDPDEPEQFGLLALLELVRAQTDLPLIAAGGIMTSSGLAAALAAGAQAAQCGTAFLRAAEAGTNPVHREALAAGKRRTMLTKAFSGRPARGLVNRFATEHSGQAPSAYPQIHHVTAPLRAAAVRPGDEEASSLWAGQGYCLAREGSAAEIVTRLTTGL